MCKELEDWLHEEKASGIAEGKAVGRAEGRAEGRVEGKAEGRVEGRAEGKAETALALLKDGFPFDKVAKYTKLSSETIETLARQHNLA